MITDIDRWLTETVAQYKAKSLYLPAGDTPRRLYEHWRASPHQALKHLTLHQIDDIMDGEQRRMFARFFDQELPNFAVREPFMYVQADLGILGFGVNGHVAFHEPELPETFTFGTVIPNDDTLLRLGVQPGTRAVTFGLGAFLKTKAILLIVSGESKRCAFERFLARDPALPATALYSHRDLTVLSDL